MFKNKVLRFAFVTQFVLCLSMSNCAVAQMTPLTLEKTRKVRTYARIVPERNDDFAWENDVIAFRAYGPAARDFSENNGFDCWMKRVDYSIINNWYANHIKGVSYHEDHGEGLDIYHVGSSAGCGGTGIWIDKKRFGLETFTSYKVIKSSVAESIVQLTYENKIKDDVYKEVKTITIQLGSQLFNVKSIFYKNGEKASNLQVCVGLTTHDGKAEIDTDRQSNVIATWETLSDASQIGTGAILPVDKKAEIIAYNSEVKDESHIFLVTRTDGEGFLEYSTGYGWNKAGVIKSLEQWLQYLKNYSLK